MADVRFLPYPKFQAFDDNGNPLTKGKVNVYAAGTTNRIDTWVDFDKSAKNANPIILNSRGEADIFFDAAAKIVLTDSDDVTVWTLDNVQPLTSQTVTGKYNLVDNGSFELDGDGDGVPDNWNTTSNTSTATIEIDTTTVAHGTNSFKFDSSGAGAGTATTANKFPVPDGDNVGVSFFVSSNNTTATNKVDLIFYDSAGGNTSTTNVWTGSGTQPSSLTLKSFGVSVPAGKTQADVKLTGVSNAETATTYFDNVQVLSQSYLFTGTPGEVTASASELNTMDGITATTSDLNSALVGPSSGTDPSLAFDTWRTPSATDVTFVSVHCSAQTDGTSDATIFVEVDESGGTSQDYQLAVAWADKSIGNGNNVRGSVSFLVISGASYRVLNNVDPNNNNTIAFHREYTL